MGDGPDIAKLLLEQGVNVRTFERGYNVPYPGGAIHWLNNDILLGIFHSYRLDEKNGWNVRLGWRSLSQVCQRWRHLIYECSSYLGMHIKCTNGSPMVNALDHLPLLPLFVYYSFAPTVPIREQDDLRIYHTLRLRGRIRHIELSLPPSTLHEALALMDETFPILEHLYLSGSFSSDSGHRLPLTLPNAFLAPHLRHLTLCDIGLPGLRALASTVSLVTLTLRNIQTSSYFRPRFLVARLGSLPLLEELTITFSIPIPRPSTESKLLGEKGAPITLPSLKNVWFHGVGTYLESFVAQIRVPLLEKLDIRLFNQIAFMLPHLFHLINNTGVFKLSKAIIDFSQREVGVSILHGLGRTAFSLGVRCKPLDWQIDCAAQICDALIPTLSGVEELLLLAIGHEEIPTDMRNGTIDSATWHDLLRTFIGVKKIGIYNGPGLTEEVSRALQVNEVGLDPEFLPNLRSICASENQFISFIDTRQVVGRPVQFQAAR